MRVTVLASGSGGNACLVEAGATRILVDAGLSAREIERRLAARGVEAGTIQALFLTHEHNDHSSGALTFSSRWGCPIFATAGTADAVGLDGSLFAPFVRIESGREGRIGSIGFRALAAPHDANELVVYSFEGDDARMAGQLAQRSAQIVGRFGRVGWMPADNGINFGVRFGKLDRGARAGGEHVGPVTAGRA